MTYQIQDMPMTGSISLFCIYDGQVYWANISFSPTVGAPNTHRFCTFPLRGPFPPIDGVPVLILIFHISRTWPFGNSSRDVNIYESSRSCILHLLIKRHRCSMQNKTWLRLWRRTSLIVTKEHNHEKYKCWHSRVNNAKASKNKNWISCKWYK